MLDSEQVNSYMWEALRRLTARKYGRPAIPYLPVSHRIRPGTITKATAERLVQANLAKWVGSTTTSIMVTSDGRDYVAARQAGE